MQSIDLKEEDVFTKTDKFFDPDNPGTCIGIACKKKVKNIFTVSEGILQGGFCDNHLKMYKDNIDSYNTYDLLVFKHLAGFKHKDYPLMTWWWCECFKTSGKSHKINKVTHGSGPVS